MKKFICGAVVLLIAISMILSTVAVSADTVKFQLKELSNSKPNKLIKQNNPRPTGTSYILSEGFEDGIMPPSGWELVQYNPTSTWYISSYDPHSGIYHALCEYDPNLEFQYEILKTPIMDFTGYTEIYLSFWWAMSYTWSVDPYDNYDFSISIVRDGYISSLWDDEWVGYYDNYEWYDTNFGYHIDLTQWNEYDNIQIWFSYWGQDGDAILLDDILIYGEGMDPPSAPYITGPSQGKPNEPQEFKYQSSDPDSINLRYHIDWDDGTPMETTGYFPAGDQIDVIHTYTQSGKYNISAYAEDEDGNVGPSSSFLFTCTKDKTKNIMFFQNLLKRFPLLQILLVQFGL